MKFLRLCSLWRWTAALTLLLVAGCEAKKPAVTDGRPSILRLGYTPAEQGEIARDEAQAVLAEYLSAQLALPVELVRTASYGPGIEALAEGRIDILSLTPFAYILAAEKEVADPIAVTAYEAGVPRYYQSALITNRRSGLTRKEDIPAKAAKLRFCYTDLASNSGYLVPKAAMEGIGVQPEQDFASVEVTLSHGVSILNVIHGRADLAGVNASVLERLIAKDRIPTDDLVVLWRSGNLPGGPVVLRRALPDNLKVEISRAFLELKSRDPVAHQAVMAQYPNPDSIFVGCTDSHYDGLRALMKPAVQE